MVGDDEFTRRRPRPLHRLPGDPYAYAEGPHHRTGPPADQQVSVGRSQQQDGGHAEHPEEGEGASGGQQRHGRGASIAPHRHVRRGSTSMRPFISMCSAWQNHWQ